MIEFIDEAYIVLKMLLETCLNVVILQLFTPLKTRSNFCENFFSIAAAI